MMITKPAISSLVLSLVLFMPAAAQTSGVPAPNDPQQVADFLDYKTRLLNLIATYRGNTTTLPEIEAIFGETSGPSTRDRTPGWIQKALPGYKSLVFANQIDLYYGSPYDKTAFKKPVYFEVQYDVSFEQNTKLDVGQPPTPVSDPATCLSVSEFKAAAALRGKVLKFGENRLYNEFHVSTDNKDLLIKGDISLLAAFRPRHFDMNQTGPMDMSEGCLVSLSVS
jgi:hypothetical protein